MMDQHSVIYMMKISSPENTNGQTLEMTWEQIWDLIETALMTGIVISIDFSKEATDEHKE